MINDILMLTFSGIKAYENWRGRKDCQRKERKGSLDLNWLLFHISLNADAEIIFETESQIFFLDFQEKAR